jgi:hypothetical protein
MYQLQPSLLSRCFRVSCPLPRSCLVAFVPFLPHYASADCSLAVEKRIAVFIVTSYSTSIYLSFDPSHSFSSHTSTSTTSTLTSTYTTLYFILLYFKTKSLTSKSCSSYLFSHLPHRQRPRLLLPVSLLFLSLVLSDTADIQSLMEQPTPPSQTSTQ